MSDANRITEMRSVHEEPGHEGRARTLQASQAVWLLFGILEVLLGLRFLFKLIAANPISPITELIYSFTHIFLIPFAGLTATPAAGGFVLELSTLVAMLIYGLIAWAIDRLIFVIFYRPKGNIVEVTQTKSSEHHSDPDDQQSKMK